MDQTNVKQTIAISSTDTLQKYVGTTATDIGVAKIKAIQAQSSAANGSVKIYDATDAATASKLVFEAKWGIEADENFTFFTFLQTELDVRLLCTRFYQIVIFLVVTFD